MARAETVLPPTMELKTAVTVAVVSAHASGRDSRDVVGDRGVDDSRGSGVALHPPPLPTDAVSCAIRSSRL